MMAAIGLLLVFVAGYLLGRLHEPAPPRAPDDPPLDRPVAAVKVGDTFFCQRCESPVCPVQRAGHDLPCPNCGGRTAFARAVEG